MSDDLFCEVTGGKNPENFPKKTPGIEEERK
jgi:hypothetical protein